MWPRPALREVWEEGAGCAGWGDGSRRLSRQGLWTRAQVARV